MSDALLHVCKGGELTIVAGLGGCRQFAQQRLKKGVVIGGWVSSFYLLLPAGLTPFLGIYIDVFGQRIAFRKCLCPDIGLAGTGTDRGLAPSVPFRSHFPRFYAAPQVLPHRPDL